MFKFMNANEDFSSFGHLNRSSCFRAKKESSRGTAGWRRDATLGRAKSLLSFVFRSLSQRVEREVKNARFTLAPWRSLFTAGTSPQFTSLGSQSEVQWVPHSALVWREKGKRVARLPRLLAILPEPEEVAVVAAAEMACPVGAKIPPFFPLLLSVRLSVVCSVVKQSVSQSVGEPGKCRTGGR